MSANSLRIGTRASALALAQSQTIADALAGAGHPDIEVVHITTSGDRGGDTRGSVDGRSEDPGAVRGDADKSRWVDAIEQALLAGAIDLAVHSAKDVPGELAEGLELLGAPARGPVEDVLCVAQAGWADGDGVPNGRGTRARTRARVPRPSSELNRSSGLDALPPGARVGTASVRRIAQLRAVREDLHLVTVAGNVDTRLGRLADPPDRAERLDAIVLARAGLRRLGREDAVGAVLDHARFVPAPGQGALALEARADDARARAAVAELIDADTTACLRAERALARALDASCHTPLGAHAAPAGCGCLQLRAWVGLPDGSAWIADELVGGFYDPDALGQRVAERMSAAGARELLTQAQAMAMAGNGV